MTYAFLYIILTPYWFVGDPAHMSVTFKYDIMDLNKMFLEEVNSQ